MQRAVTESALRSSSLVAKTTRRFASTSQTSSSFSSTINGPAGRRVENLASKSSPSTVTENTGSPVSTKFTAASQSLPEAYPGKPAALFENEQIEKGNPNEKTETIPNPRPYYVSDWVHNIVSQSKMLQSILYGVQNPAETSGLWSKLKGDSAKRRREEKGNGSGRVRVI